MNLLDWCCDEHEIKVLIDGFLLDYLAKFQYNPDDVLNRYLIHLLDHSSFSWYWSQGEAAPWEATASVILQFIKDVSLKLDLTLVILRQAPVPWSSLVKNIAKDGYDLKDPRKDLLTKEERLVTVKEMVTKYQAGKSFNRKGREAERLLQCMFKHLSHENGQDIFNDALKVSQVMDGVGPAEAKLFYVEKLVEQDRIREAVEFLDDQDGPFIVEMMLVKAERKSTAGVVSFLKLASVCKPQLLEYLSSRVDKAFKKCKLEKLLDEKSIEELISDLTQEKIQVALVKMHKVSRFSFDYNFSDLVQQFIKALEVKDQAEEIEQVLRQLNEHREDYPNLDFLNEVQFIKELSLMQSNIVSNDKYSIEKSLFKSNWMYFVGLQLQQHQGYDKSVILDSEELLQIEKKMKGNQFWDKGLPVDPEVADKCTKMFKFLSQLKEAKSEAMEDEMDITVLSPIEIQEDVDNSEELLESIVPLVEDIYEHLLGKNHILMALQFLKSIEWPLVTYQTPKDFLNRKRQELVNELMTHVLMERVPDLPLALGILMGESKIKEGMKILSQLDLGSNAKLVHVARLGSRYCSRLKLLAPKDQYMRLLLSTVWSNELNIKGTTLATLEQGSPQYFQLLTHAYLTKNLNNIIPNLVQYAKAFGLATSALMELLVKTMLKDQANNEVLNEALKLIPNENERESLIRDLVLMASPYSYELLGHLFTMLQDERNMQMIMFLKTYKRLMAPSEAEKDDWLDTKSSPFPMLEAKQKLPFHPLMEASNNPKEMFKLLSNEFTIDTYQHWLTVCKLFKLGSTSIRVFAVQNTVSMILNNFHESLDEEHWYTQPIIPTQSMEKIIECLEGIPDFYKANCAIHSISKKLPRGNEKLLLARLGLDFANKLHEEKNDDSSAQTLNFAHQASLRLEVEAILHRNGLYTQKYLDLVQQMNLVDLIMNLYDDPSVLEQSPGVNKAAREIAEVVNDKDVLNLTLISWKLLDEWLPDEETENAMDETMNNFNIIKAMAKTSETADKTGRDTRYWKCIYILQGFLGNNETEGCEYLFHVTFSTEPKWTPDQKLRALKCLLSVMGSEALEESIGKPVHELEQRFQSLVLMSQLQSLNMPYHSVEAIDKCDKVALVESILRNCGHLEAGIALIVDLCSFHQIYNSTIWAKILAKLKTARQEKVLKTALKAVNARPHLWHLPEFRQCWQQLILKPLQKLSSGVPTEECSEVCRQSLALLQGCPVATDIEMKTLRDMCAKYDVEWKLT